MIELKVFDYFLRRLSLISSILFFYYLFIYRSKTVWISAFMFSKGQWRFLDDIFCWNSKYGIISCRDLHGPSLKNFFTVIFYPISFVCDISSDCSINEQNYSWYSSKQLWIVLIFEKACDLLNSQILWAKLQSAALLCKVSWS